MNPKPNSITIDLKIHFKRTITLPQLIRWALPVLVAVGHYIARLNGL